MSYNSNNSNYSYYNANSANWWGSKDSTTPRYEEKRVEYPSDRNSSSYSSQSFTPNLATPSENRTSSESHTRHDVVQGKVTQLFTSFGYINDNIIFSKTDVSGPMVKVGDTVIVEASYQPNNPMKYKGERVIRMESSRFEAPNLQKMKPLTREALKPISTPKRTETRSHDRRDDRKPEKRKRFSPIKISKPEPSKSKASSSKKSHSMSKQKSPRKKTPEPTRKPLHKESSTASEKKKSLRATPDTVFPYDNLAIREMDSAIIKYKYNDLTPPKQFFHVGLKYQSAYPLNHPMKLGNKCHFKVLCKKVDCVDKYTNEKLNEYVEPEDADSTFTVKVILLSMDDLSDFYKNTLEFAEELDVNKKVPITKAIRFLVEAHGEHEMAIGGAWSPSLDGADPDTDSQVLINTAIRTVNSVTGIDLSGCSSWQKFLEFHYYRPMEKIQRKPMEEDKDTDVEETIEYREPRMETVVYYIPDIWNCLPSQESWTEIQKLYQEQLVNILCPPPPPPVVGTVAVKAASQPSSPKEADSSKGSVELSLEDSVEEEDYNFNDEDSKSPNNDVAVAGTTAPTHFSKLTVDSMKVAEIKQELELRKMNHRGIMAQLKARLKSALEKEESEEKNKATDVVIVEDTKEDQSATSLCTLSESEKAELKKAYTLSDSPHIIVHQNKKHLGGHLKLRPLSLHSLLSYSKAEFPEATFELAVFGRQFLQMLNRDAIFTLYKTIVMTPESEFHVKVNDAKKPKLMVTTSKRTVNRHLLFCCSILDKDQRGHLNIDELRHKFESLGICLSVNQLNTVLDKVKKDVLKYRVLTDKEVSDSDISKMMNSGLCDDLDYIKELSMGNKALFESEDYPMDAGQGGADAAEMDRMRTELDRSERMRQAMAQRMVEARDQADSHLARTRGLVDEGERLRAELDTMRTRHHNERERADTARRDVDRLQRDLNRIASISERLSEACKSNLKNPSSSSRHNGRSSVVALAPVPEKKSQVVVEVDEDDDIEMIDEQDLDQNTDTVAEDKTTAASSDKPVSEDFELSKPFDIVILDEAE